MRARLVIESLDDTESFECTFIRNIIWSECSDYFIQISNEPVLLDVYIYLCIVFPPYLSLQLGNKIIDGTYCGHVIVRFMGASPYLESQMRNEKNVIKQEKYK